MSKAVIEQSPLELRILTSYDAGFVAALKLAIPYGDRQWQKPAWIVATNHLPAVLRLLETFFGGAEVKLVGQGNGKALAASVEHYILIEYLGACKVRDDGNSSAYGFWNGGWNVIFPEEVLRAYFKAGSREGNSGKTVSESDCKSQSFYQCLAVGKDANTGEIKSAYKRLARIWHPDINHEEDAQTRFIAIKRAYDILADPAVRRRYDAGLQLAASLKTSQRSKDNDEWAFQMSFYRAPFTCGKVELKGVSRLGRIHVESIGGWRDQVNAQGKTMVSSWSREDQTFVVEWVADFEVEV
jgi:hypothetical protein